MVQFKSTLIALTYLSDLIRVTNTLGNSRGPLQGVDTSVLYRGLPHPEAMGPGHHGRHFLLHAQHGVGGGSGV